MLLDRRIHEGLRTGRLVCFIVPPSPVTHQIYHHIFFERVTEIQRQLRHE